MTTQTYQREYYQRRKARGKCLDCDHPKLATETRCAECAEDQRQISKQTYRIKILQRL